MLKGIQRRMLIRVISAYRTILAVAENTIAGLTSIHIMIQKKGKDARAKKERYTE